MKPLIGITAAPHVEGNRDWVYNTRDYFRAVQNAGGIPVLLPFVETEEQAAEILDRIDGLLLSGGSDIDPKHYGETVHPQCGTIEPERDATELAMARLAIQRDMPVFGICRGHQVLAVAFGGTLYQDIPAQVPGKLNHQQVVIPRNHEAHGVNVKPGSRLANIVGLSPRVNTRHHQAVKDVPPGWVESAVSEDGINEAMEYPACQFAMSVQWHPENFTAKAYSFDSLFRAFVEACKHRQ